MSQPRPTFSSKWDHLTYLLAQYRVLVAGLLVGVGVWVVYAEPSLPTLPPEVGATALFWTVGGLPMWIVGVNFVRWLRRRNMVTVHHVDARQPDQGGSETDAEKYLVPPETWAEKTIEGPQPYPMNGGTAWGVQEFEYHEDADELVVSGVWMSETEDAKLMSSRRHVDEIHGWLLSQYRKLSAVRDRVSRLGIDVEERTINAASAAREKGEMLDTTAVKEAVEQATDDVPDPESPPTLEDAMGADPDDPIGDLSPSVDPESDGAATDGGEQ